MAVYNFSKKLEGNNSLTEHFKVKEFACRDGSDYVPIDLDLVYKLEEIRQHFGKPIFITSAFRTESYNKKIGGASSSYHTKGMAFDIVVQGVSPFDVAHFAQGLWIMGIGCYKDDGFVHIDGRSQKAFWYNQSVKATDTFGNYPSCECYVKNVRLAHMADGWSFPKHGLSWDGNDEEFRNVLKASVVKKSHNRSNVAMIVQHTIGANEDGIVGDGTINIIKDWQSAHGLTADGVWGEQCWLEALGLKQKDRPSPAPSPKPQPEPVSYTASDALTALQASVGKIKLTDEQKKKLDIDGDGKVTVSDSLKILQAAVEKR